MEKHVNVGKQTNTETELIVTDHTSTDGLGLLGLIEQSKSHLATHSFTMQTLTHSTHSLITRSKKDYFCLHSAHLQMWQLATHVLHQNHKNKNRK